MDVTVGFAAQGSFTAKVIELGCGENNKEQRRTTRNNTEQQGITQNNKEQYRTTQNKTM